MRKILLTMLTVGYIVWAELQRREQNEKIEQLISKVNVLEGDKEEE